MRVIIKSSVNTGKVSCLSPVTVHCTYIVIIDCYGSMIVQSTVRHVVCHNGLSRRQVQFQFQFISRSHQLKHKKIHNNTDDAT